MITVQTRITKKAFARVCAVTAGVIVAVSLARAETPKLEAPCAVLEKFGGQVYVLDPSRTQLIDARLGSPIPCEGWVSVESGWAELQHRDGFKFNLADATFVQISQSLRVEKGLEKDLGDHLVIYKGQVLAQASPDQGELRMVSPNARGRMKSGAAIFSFLQDSEETQLVSIERKATLENRFEPSMKVTAAAGEATSLTIKNDRIIPSAPKAVTLATLRPKLVTFHLEEDRKKKALKTALNRQDRKFATDLAHERRYQEADRVPAALEFSEKGASNYQRHPSASASGVRPAQPLESEAMHDSLARKVGGGEKVGSQILFPEEYHGKAQRSELEVVDKSADKIGSDPERRRLMEELSKIKVTD